MGDTKNKVEGTFNEAKGTVTGDDDEKAKGQGQRAMGDAESGNLGDAAKNAGNAVSSAVKGSDDDNS